MVLLWVSDNHSYKPLYKPQKRLINKCKSEYENKIYSNQTKTVTIKKISKQKIQKEKKKKVKKEKKKIQ